MNIYYCEKTKEFEIGKTYRFTPKNKEIVNEPTHATLVYINNHFENGRVLLFDNTQCFIIGHGHSIYRFTYENDREMIDDSVEYELECFTPYLLK